MKIVNNDYCKDNNYYNNNNFKDNDFKDISNEIQNKTSEKNKGKRKLNTFFSTLLRSLNTKKSQITDLIFKGIPLTHKGNVWLHIIRNKKEYIHINNHTYSALYAKSSGFEYQIHVDIQRTFRTHVLF